ncbi:hypothetical protein NGRA_1479 [Nosema granulosis]|uniref:Transmembrane protein n=1 Tax=Nosema granulosis TaxID=83296 RepID=A0A9P6GYD6_9MICR|nr:hypothetical protein NGRA_1479 [Nosema granulosis]
MKFLFWLSFILGTDDDINTIEIENEKVAGGKRVTIHARVKDENERFIMEAHKLNQEKVEKQTPNDPFKAMINISKSTLLTISCLVVIILFSMFGMLFGGYYYNNYLVLYTGIYGIFSIIILLICLLAFVCYELNFGGII